MIFTIIWYIFRMLGFSNSILLPIGLDFATLIFFGMIVGTYYSAKKTITQKEE